MTAILNEHTQYLDTGGRPLVNGLLYIGDVGADPIANPQAVFSDRALTVAAANPQTLDANGRTTVKLFIGGEFSLQVNDVNAVQVYQNLQAGEAASDVSTTELTNVVGGDTITAEGIPTVLAYNDKAQFIFTAAQVNSDAVTLNIDGLGAKSVLKNHDEELIANEIEADQIVLVVYNATDDVFEVTNQNIAVQIRATEKFSDVNFVTQSSSFTVEYTDIHSFIDVDTINLVITEDSVANLEDGFEFTLRNSSGRNTIHSPAASALIGGNLLYTQADNTTIRVVCDGTDFQVTVLDEGIGGHIEGLGTSNSGSDADHDIVVAIGRCHDDSAAPKLMGLDTARTKQIDAPWVFGNNQGGLDTGTVAVDSWYHIFVIERTTTGGTVDVLFSLSPTAPTLPSGYTLKRRIGSVLTDGSANIIAYTQNGDDWSWDDVVTDFNATNPGTAAVTRTLSVPTGVRILWHGAGIHKVFGVGGDESALFTSLDVNDVAASATNAQLVVSRASSSQIASSELRIFTNTSAQIRTRLSISGGSDTLVGVTYGWQDKRGRLS